MKRNAFAVALLFSVSIWGSVWATDDTTIQDRQTNVSTTKSKADKNAFEINSLKGGLPVEAEARKASDAALQEQIDNIELLPGPPGPVGPEGPQGLQGEVGPMGLEGPPGICEVTLEEFQSLVQRVELLEALVGSGEICHDRLDNNGNGLIDEGCPCIPEEEICDGLDNNCDGVVDERCLTLQNDSFISGDTLNFLTGTVLGEEVAVSLGPVDGIYVLDQLHFIFGPEGSAPVPVQINIYKEVGMDMPGPLLLTQFVDLGSGDDIQVLDLRYWNLIISNGESIRVSVQISSEGDFGSGVAMDSEITAGRNWLQSGGVWSAGEGLGLCGDFVIRAVLYAQ